MRRSKLTPELAQKIYQLLEDGNKLETACRAVGITVRTYHLWTSRGRAEIERVESCDRCSVRQEEQPFVDFAQSTDLARAKGEAFHVEIIRSAAPSDWRASAWYLEHAYPERWGRRRVELSGPDGGPVKIQREVMDMSDEELEAIASEGPD